MRTASIQDVAAHADVVPSTVSKVLNDYKGVSALTREKVLKAVEELNYRPNKAARSFRTGTTQTVSVFTPRVGDEFFDRLITSIDNELASNDYDAALFPLLNQKRLERYRLPHALPYQADGIIMASLNPDWLFENAKFPVKLPTVLVDAYHADYDTVTVANAEGAYRATQHLLERPAKTFIVTLEEPKENTFSSGVFMERLKGFERALEEAGKSFDNSIIETDLSTEGGRTALGTALANSKPPLNIFATCDLIAKGVLEEAQSRDLELGQAVRLVGFDDQPWAEAAELSTVRQPIGEIGTKAVELLQARLEKPKRKVRHEEFKTELVVRHSSGG